jgi:hypothetical protein
MSTIPVQVTNDPLPFESIWIKFPKCKILLFAAYVPPNLCKEIMDLIVTKIIEQADQMLQSSPSFRVILAGDLNQLPTQEIEDELNVVQTISVATRGKAILDKVLMQETLVNSYHTPVIGPNLGKSDHRTIFVNPVCKFRESVQVKSLYDLRESQMAKVRSELLAVPWHHFYKSDASVNEKCNLFHEILSSALCHIPKDEIVVAKTDKPWITPLIISLINKRYAAFRAKNYRLYEHFKIKVRNAIVNAKQNWVRRVNTRNQNPWKIINAVRNKERGNQLCDIINSFTTRAEAANAINQNFAKHYSQPSMITSFHDGNEDSWNVEIGTHLVYNLLSKLKTNKSSGSDGLSPRILVALADVICEPLTHIFCLSIDFSQVPQKWKLANVCPVPKKSHPNISDLRPISVLPIFSKLLEKVVLPSVQPSLIKMYGTNQFGFRPHSSTLHANISLHNYITEQLEHPNSKAVMLISTDFKRAFDSLFHHELLSSLKEGQLPKSFLKWCKSFLEERLHRVVLDESAISSPVLATSGVPQGSVLSPYLFAAHLGSLKTSISEAQMIKYADDVVTVVPIQDHSLVDALIHQHLGDTQLWANQNGLKLNCDKTKVLIVAKKGLSVVPAKDDNLCFLHHEIKFLGVSYNAKLTWTSHISQICNKARRNLFILKQLKRFADKRCMVSAYTNLVLSVLEYCGPLLLGIDSTNEGKMEKVRRRAHLIICGARCECSSFEVLASRRKRQAMKIFQTFANPQNILHHLYPNSLPITKHLVMPLCKTKRRHSAFIPQCVLLHNASL